MHPLSTVAPEFVEMAHRIVWCVVGTTDAGGLPRTRVLHPIWEWDGHELTGWIATSPNSPKAADLSVMPEMSITYWAPNHDTCTADCGATFEQSAAGADDGMGTVRQRARTGRVRPCDHPWMGRPRVTGLRDRAADPSPTPGDARHAHAGRAGRVAHLEGVRKATISALVGNDGTAPRRVVASPPAQIAHATASSSASPAARRAAKRSAERIAGARAVDGVDLDGRVSGGRRRFGTTRRGDLDAGRTHRDDHGRHTSVEQGG